MNYTNEQFQFKLNIIIFDMFIFSTAAITDTIEQFQFKLNVLVAYNRTISTLNQVKSSNDNSKYLNYLISNSRTECVSGFCRAIKLFRFIFSNYLADAVTCNIYSSAKS